MAGYDITGISPIGLNFGGAFGDYSGYMPSSMGMMGMSNLTGGYGSGYGAYGAMGMAGMMAPMMEYQQYMTRLQNQLDLESLNHTRTMHQGMISNEVQAHEDSISGIIQKLLADSSVQGGVKTLHDKIVAGDQNGIVQEYNKLEQIVLSKYSAEIKAHGSSVSVAVDAREIIELAYNNLVNATVKDGQEHSIKADIDRYCDSAFKEGLVSGFRGESNQRYKEETLNHIYGTRIQHRQSKQGQEKLGKGIGIAGSVFRDIGEGAALGAGAFVAGGAAANFISLLWGSKWWFKGGGVKTGAGIAALIGIAALGAHDIIKRQNSKKEAV